jgi:diaminohydroxyphosphoribosylaminopyrimidine deaminase/5-amino-6-(5-phosphoribosylamino)uracil reductase
MTDAADLKFMRRCLDLAGRAEGMTYPNPVVGAVIVFNGLIIGEGYHQKSGKPHAEVNAIESVTDKSLLSRSTLYVSLEPCSHTGKTPPCTDLIISHSIPKVVVGTVDTSDKVSGSGLERLRKAGCKIIKGVLEAECRHINRRFFTFHEKKRPYITLKWAQSADGFIDIMRPVNSPVEPYWISGKPERVLVHKWRASEQSILVGAGTVRNDNPGLNVRYWKGNDPVRIIISRSGDIGNYLINSKSNSRIIIFTCNTSTDYGRAEKVILGKKTPAAEQVIDYLYKSEIQSVLVEGGAQVLDHFIETGLWDEARIFIGNNRFNKGLKAPLINGKLFTTRYFGTSSLKLFLNEADNNSAG